MVSKIVWSWLAFWRCCFSLKKKSAFSMNNPCFRLFSLVTSWGFYMRHLVKEGHTLVWKCSCCACRTCFHRSLRHPGRAPGRHHMTISESLTCFSDPKDFSLKFFPENEEMQNLCSSGSFPFTVKLLCWSFQELFLCVNPIDTFVSLDLS